MNSFETVLVLLQIDWDESEEHYRAWEQVCISGVTGPFAAASILPLDIAGTTIGIVTWFVV